MFVVCFLRFGEKILATGCSLVYKLLYCLLLKRGFSVVASSLVFHFRL